MAVGGGARVAVRAGGAPSGAPPTVLVADDDARVRDLVALVLARGGLAVVQAGDGDAALALARRVRPALALLDVVMPGPDGIAVCRVLKAEPATAAMPVVLLTAAEGADVRAHAAAACADAYLTTPFSPAALLALVRRLLPPRAARPAGQPHASGGSGAGASESGVRRRAWRRDGTGRRPPATRRTGGWRVRRRAGVGKYGPHRPGARRACRGGVRERRRSMTASHGASCLPRPGRQPADAPGRLPLVARGRRTHGRERSTPAHQRNP